MSPVLLQYILKGFDAHRSKPDLPGVPGNWPWNARGALTNASLPQNARFTVTLYPTSRREQELLIELDGLSDERKSDILRSLALTGYAIDCLGAQAFLASVSNFTADEPRVEITQLHQPSSGANPTSEAVTRPIGSGRIAQTAREQQLVVKANVPAESRTISTAEKERSAPLQLAGVVDNGHNNIKPESSDNSSIVWVDENTLFDGTPIQAGKNTPSGENPDSINRSNPSAQPASTNVQPAWENQSTLQAGEHGDDVGEFLLSTEPVRTRGEVEVIASKPMGVRKPGSRASIELAGLIVMDPDAAISQQHKRIAP